MPATPEPAANLDPEVAAACARRLAQLKGRDDIEVLAVTAVAPTRLYGAFGSAPGLAFTVEFSYTRGRRQRRTAEVAWALTASRNLDRYPGVPAALWQLLNDALEGAAAS